MATKRFKPFWFREKLTISPEKSIQIAWLTAGQREKWIWAAVRKYE